VERRDCESQREEKRVHVQLGTETDFVGQRAGEPTRAMTTCAIVTTRRGTSTSSPLPPAAFTHNLLFVASFLVLLPGPNRQSKKENRPTGSCLPDSPAIWLPDEPSPVKSRPRFVWSFWGRGVAGSFGWFLPRFLAAQDFNFLFNEATASGFSWLP
jgi:hypothetical protein